MIPDLGKYTGTVLSSYAVSITLLVLLVGFSLLRARRVRAQLKQIEERMKRNG